MSMHQNYWRNVHRHVGLMSAQSQHTLILSGIYFMPLIFFDKEMKMKVKFLLVLFCVHGEISLCTLVGILF